MTLLKKTYTGHMVLKRGDGVPEGSFEADFATLNVKDLDGDVTLPGAFGAQPGVLIEPWNHNYSQLPVGKGDVSERDNKASVAGQFFLDTPNGLDHYNVVKALGDTQEWSYTFYIKEAEFGVFNGEDVRFLKKMDVVGVSPVMRGAGIDTGTTMIKGAKQGDNGEGEGGDAKPSTDVAAVLVEIDIAEIDLDPEED